VKQEEKRLSAADVSAGAGAGAKKIVKVKKA
jgi:hypothetical protein